MNSATTLGKPGSPVPMGHQKISSETPAARDNIAIIPDNPPVREKETTVVPVTSRKIDIHLSGSEKSIEDLEKICEEQEREIVFLKGRMAEYEEIINAPAISTVGRIEQEIKSTLREITDCTDEDSDLESVCEEKPRLRKTDKERRKTEKTVGSSKHNRLRRKLFSLQTQKARIENQYQLESDLENLQKSNEYLVLRNSELENKLDILRGGQDDIIITLLDRVIDLRRQLADTKEELYLAHQYSSGEIYDELPDAPAMLMTSSADEGADAGVESIHGESVCEESIYEERDIADRSMPSQSPDELPAQKDGSIERKRKKLTGRQPGVVSTKKRKLASRYKAKETPTSKKRKANSRSFSTRTRTETRILSSEENPELSRLPASVFKERVDKNDNESFYGSDEYKKLLQDALLQAELRVTPTQLSESVKYMNGTGLRVPEMPEIKGAQHEWKVFTFRYCLYKYHGKVQWLTIGMLDKFNEATEDYYKALKAYLYKSTADVSSVVCRWNDRKKLSLPKTGVFREGPKGRWGNAHLHYMMWQCDKEQSGNRLDMSSVMLLGVLNVVCPEQKDYVQLIAEYLFARTGAYPGGELDPFDKSTSKDIREALGNLKSDKIPVPEKIGDHVFRYKTWEEESVLEVLKINGVHVKEKLYRKTGLAKKVGESAKEKDHKTYYETQKRILKQNKFRYATVFKQYKSEPRFIDIEGINLEEMGSKFANNASIIFLINLYGGNISSEQLKKTHNRTLWCALRRIDNIDLHKKLYRNLMRVLAGKIKTYHTWMSSIRSNNRPPPEGKRWTKELYLKLKREPVETIEPYAQACPEIIESQTTPPLDEPGQ